MILELREPLWFDSPKGKVLAKFVIDQGTQSNLQWVCFSKQTGECWTIENADVKLEKNITMGIRVNE